MASSLLRDGTGPMHNRHSPVSLGDAVREATRQMTNPLAGAPSGGTDRESSACRDPYVTTGEGCRGW
jgi:hypothetical protein